MLLADSELRRAPQSGSSRRRDRPLRPTPIEPGTPEEGCPHRRVLWVSYVQGERLSARSVHKKHAVVSGRGKEKAALVEDDGPVQRGRGKDKMRDGSEGTESFPDLGNTVGEAGLSPHRSKGQQKYRSSPVAVHEKAGAPESSGPIDQGRRREEAHIVGYYATGRLEWSGGVLGHRDGAISSRESSSREQPFRPVG
jgi:hypothetical protein